MIKFLRKYLALLFVISYSVSISVFAINSYSANLKDTTYEQFTFIEKKLKTSTQPTTIYRPYNVNDFVIKIDSVDNILLTPAKPTFMESSEFFLKAYGLENSTYSRDAMYTKFSDMGWKVTIDQNLIRVTDIPELPNTLGIVSFTDIAEDPNYKTSIDGVFINFS